MVNIEGLKEVSEKEVNGQLSAKLAELKAQLEALTNKKGGTEVAKNKRAVNPDPGRKYVLLTKQLESWGRVPQQQRDIATLLSQLMTVGQEYSEAEVFAAVTDYACEFDSIRKSVQHPTYLFAYYRGLKNDGKHAGFIARNFLRQIG